MGDKISAEEKPLQPTKRRNWQSSLAMVMLGIITSACSAFQPPEASGPRANEPLYPVLYSGSADRIKESLLTWSQLTQQGGLTSKPEIQLDPYTATIKGFPANANVSLYLPKVGSAETPSEEETRESLRRFIDQWQRLMGAEPAQLTLVERTDNKDGTKEARYEQHPFRYPLRGGYGKLLIRFRTDRRVIDLSSTCIPDTDRLQTAIATMTPQLNWKDAASHVSNQSLTYNDLQGQQHSYTLPPNTKADVKQLVIYPIPSTSKSDSLELHLAWEIDVADAPFKTVYLDAVRGEIIAAG